MLYLLDVFRNYHRQVGTVVNIGVVGLIFKWVCYYLNDRTYVGKGDIGDIPTNFQKFDDNLVFIPLATMVVSFLIKLIFRKGGGLNKLANLRINIGDNQPLISSASLTAFEYLKELGVRVGLSYGLYYIFYYPVSKHVVHPALDLYPSNHILTAVVLTTVWMCICMNTEFSEYWKVVHFLAFVLVAYQIYTVFWVAFIFQGTYEVLLGLVEGIIVVFLVFEHPFLYDLCQNILKKVGL